MISVILAILCIGLLWLVGGASEASGELIVKSAASAAVLMTFPLVYLWKFLKTPSLLSREQEGRRRLLEEKLKIITDQQGLRGLPSEICSLRPGKEIRFDCEKAQNFHFTQLYQVVVLRPPENPREGIYRLYLVSGIDNAVLFAVDQFYKWTFPRGVGLIKTGELMIFEINILKNDGKFMAFGHSIYYSGAVHHLVNMPARHIDPVGQERCKIVTPAPHYIHSKPQAVFGSSGEQMGRFEVDVPVRWWGAHYRFRVHFSCQDRSQQGATVVFRLSYVNEHYHSEMDDFKVATSATESSQHGQGWSEISQKSVSSPGFNRFIITRDANDERDNCTCDVLISSIEVEFVTKH